MMCSTFLANVVMVASAGEANTMLQSVIKPHLGRAAAQEVVRDLLTADEPGLGNVTMQLLRSFRIRGACSEYRRLGPSHDGGYITCMDGHEDVVGALSLGVQKHDKWTLDAHEQFGVNVAQFDCTVDEGEDCNGSCKFFKTCVGTPDGIVIYESQDSFPEVISLSEAVEMAGFGSADEVQDGTLLLKM